MYGQICHQGMLICAYEWPNMTGAVARGCCVLDIWCKYKLYGELRKNCCSQKTPFPKCGYQLSFASLIYSIAPLIQIKESETRGKVWHLFLLTHLESFLWKVWMVYRFSLPAICVTFWGNKDFFPSIGINAQLCSINCSIVCTKAVNLSHLFST